MIAALAAMTIFGYFMPMTKSRRIVFLVYDGFELLDMSGPVAVFCAANDLAGLRLYTTVVASARGGTVSSSGGIVVKAVRWGRLRIGTFDTALIVGALEGPLTAAMHCRALTKALRTSAVRAGRFGSVCTGAFLLGAAGLLNDKNVATHWAGCTQLARRFPNARVQADSMYVADGRLWTSAGVTTGIDMALAMVKQDHGVQMMGRIAKQLVLYAHRPGHQSQFSELLRLQSTSGGDFSELSTWLEGRLAGRLLVSDMARRSGLSPRTFHRRFTAAMGMTPFKYLDALRLERAKRHLESQRPIKWVATQVGFQSESAFRAAFRKRFGVTPAYHSEMHGSGRAHVATSD